MSRPLLYRNHFIKVTKTFLSQSIAFYFNNVTIPFSILRPYFCRFKKLIGDCFAGPHFCSLQQKSIVVKYFLFVFITPCQSLIAQVKEINKMLFTLVGLPVVTHKRKFRRRQIWLSQSMPWDVVILIVQFNLLIHC